jgi:hypothetical protein
VRSLPRTVRHFQTAASKNNIPTPFETNTGFKVWLVKISKILIISVLSQDLFIKTAKKEKG